MEIVVDLTSPDRIVAPVRPVPPPPTGNAAVPFTLNNDTQPLPQYQQIDVIPLGHRSPPPPPTATNILPSDKQSADAALRVLAEQQRDAFDARLRLLSQREQRLHEWEQSLRHWEAELLRREEINNNSCSSRVAPSIGPAALDRFDDRLRVAMAASSSQAFAGPSAAAHWDRFN